MRKKRKNITEIFASGGSITTGKSGGGYWNNEPNAHTWEGAGGESGDTGGINTKIKTGTGVTGAKVGNAVAAAAPLLQAGISAIDTGKHTGGRVSVGAQTANMAVQGAALGTSIVPGWGTLIGAVVGAGAGLWKGSADNRKAKREIDSDTRRTQQMYALNEYQPNIDMYGNRYEDGGLTPTEDVGYEEVPQKQLPPARKTINVEKDEIMINPMDMTIVQEFTNPNRFASHKKNQFMEPHGNFVTLPEGHVIIPKKLANRFKKGDVLTRKSIVMDILSKQANDPYHNTPEEAIPEGAEQYAGGGLTGPGGINPPKPRKYIIPTSEVSHLDEPFQQPDPSGKYTYLTGPIQTVYGKNKMGGSFATKVNIGTPELEYDLNPKAHTNLVPEMDKIPDGSINVNSGNTGGSTTPDGYGGKTTKRKFNIGRAGRVIAQNAPILAQMMTNNTGDPYLRPNPNINYSEAISLAGQLPEDVSIAGTLAANDRSFLMASKAIDNNDTPAARAEKSQLLAEKFAGDNAAYQGREMARTQLRSTKLQTLLGLKEKQGADWQQDTRYLMTEKRMDAAARDNNRGAALVNLSENAMKMQNDDERIKVLNAMTHSVDIDPLAQEIMKDDPGYGSFVIQYVLNGKGDYLQARNEYLTNREAKRKKTEYDKTVADNKGKETRTTGTKKETSN